MCYCYANHTHFQKFLTHDGPPHYKNYISCSENALKLTYSNAWAAPVFFSWGGGAKGGGKGQGMWGQILAMEGLLVDAWTITGGSSWGARPVQPPFLPPR